MHVGSAERQQQQDHCSSQQLERSPDRVTPGLTTAAVTNSNIFCQQQPSVAATTAEGSYAAAVVSTARAATATVEVVASPTASNSPAISPKLTRARKKLRTMSEAFNQLDGSACSPPPSPEARDQSRPASPEGLFLPAGCLSQPAGSLRVPALAPPPPPPPWSKLTGPAVHVPANPPSPPVPDEQPSRDEPPRPSSSSPALAAPPTPPPWSKHLPSYWKAVICKLCLAACHGTGFNSCHECYI